MERSVTSTDELRAPSGLTLLLLFTLVLRFGVLFLMPGSLADDPDGYRRLAENLVEYGTLGEGRQPTAYRPPLYPLVLAPCVACGEHRATVAIGLLHLGLGLGTVALAWFLARRCRLGRWVWLPGALVACDPILLGQSRLVMTETLAAFLVAWALLCLVRLVERPDTIRAVAAGTALAACGLCRPELLLWVAFCVPVLWMLLRATAGLSSSADDTGGQANHGTPPFSHVSLQTVIRTRRVVLLGSFLAAAALVLLPWAVRNQIQFGRPIVATTHGGYTLLLANNPSFYAYLRNGAWGSVWDARGLGPDWGGDAEHESPAGELAADRRAYDEAWSNIRHQPGRFAYACLIRAGRFWALAPHQGSRALRLTVGTWYLVELTLAAVGFGIGLRTRFAAGLWLWGGLLAASMTAAHTVYWSNMRMRGPLMIMVGIGVSVAIASWTDRRQKL